MQNGWCISGSGVPTYEFQLGYGGAAIKQGAVVKDGWAARLAHRLGRRPPVDDDIMIPLAGNIVFVGYLFAKDLFAFL